VLTISRLSPADVVAAEQVQDGERAEAFSCHERVLVAHRLDWPARKVRIPA
jgi:hypothetical protein